MIQALSTPGSGRVLLDGNDTVIKIQSSNGFDHFFRASIYINGVFFDEQGWSRVDDYTATRNLKHLLKAYFTSQFNEVFTPGLTEQTHLIRRIKIEITEYNLTSGAVTGSLTLPEFYVLHNLLPEHFNDAEIIKILGIEPELMVVPVNGKIAIPFFVNSQGYNVQINLETDNGTGIDSIIYSAFTGKKIFYYRYNLANTSLGGTVNYLRLIIYCGDNSIEKLLRIMHLPVYPFKEIAFRNNFGYYLYAYPFGEMEKESSLDIDTYLVENGALKASQINQEFTYSINTGLMRHNEKAIINQVATSIDPKLNTAAEFATINGTGNWVSMVPKTKKINLFKDKQHNYNNELQFTISGGQNVANTGFISVLPAVPDIQITGFTLDGRKVTVSFILNNGFSTGNLRLQFRTANSSSWITQPVVLTSSPFVFSLSTNQYYIRLIDWNNQTNVSNQIFVDITD